MVIISLNQLMKSRAFTLVELIVVVTIILLIACIVVPAVRHRLGQHGTSGEQQDGARFDR